MSDAKPDLASHENRQKSGQNSGRKSRGSGRRALQPLSLADLRATIGGYGGHKYP